MYSLLRHLLYKLDPETAHHAVSALVRIASATPLLRELLRARYCVEDPRLAVQVLGLTFRNPVGLAAGFDKNARLIHSMANIGFGFMEVGSVTALPSQGNPRPRLFRLFEDQALVNRMGLNNDGVEAVMARLPRVRPFPVGISVAKSNRPEIVRDRAIEDFVASYRQVHLPGDFVVIDVSCPNTEDGTSFGADPKALDDLLTEIRTVPSAVPVLVKFSPDLTNEVFEEGIAVCVRHSIHGVVLTNTSARRAGVRTSPQQIESIGRGGLSGPPIRARSTEMVALAYRLTHGRLPIIGVGGVDSAETAYEKICAGASLVELYTGMVYRGPTLMREINRGLLRFLARDGFTSIAQAVGSAHRNLAAASSNATAR